MVSVMIFQAIDIKTYRRDNDHRAHSPKRRLGNPDESSRANRFEIGVRLQQGWVTV